MSNQINASKEPKIGEVLNVMTSNPPPAQTMVEIIKGKSVVALGVVGEKTSNHSYQVMVVLTKTE
jgi:TusA-related sulfurtransferase